MNRAMTNPFRDPKWTFLGLFIAGGIVICGVLAVYGGRFIREIFK